MKNIFRRLARRRHILILQLIASVVVVAMVYRLGLIPMKYIAILALLLAVLLMIFYFVLEPFKKRKHGKKHMRYFFGRLCSFLLSVMMFVASAYIYRSGSAIKKMTGQDDEVTTYSVIVLDSSEAQELSDISNKTLGVGPNVDSDNQSYVLEQIGSEITFDQKDYLNFQAESEGLTDGSVDAILINESYRDVFEEDDEDFSDTTRVIWTYEITSEIDTSVETDSDANPAGTFIAYISGVDSRGSVKATSRSDVNMIVTVNTNTHKILLTSIPRDYYVTLANAGKKDKLTHSGLFGTENTVKTVEGFMDIDIDYYVRVNFTALVNLVDALGGIDVYSDKAIAHMQGGYDLSVKKGVNHMDGKLALAFARERYAYASGDRHRTQNQQDVLQAIFKKLIKPSVLSNFNDVLSAIEDCFITNMDDDTIKSLVSTQLNTNASWSFTNSYLDGSGKMMTGGYMMPSTKLYYMIPDESTITEAQAEIAAILDGKDLSSD